MSTGNFHYKNMIIPVLMSTTERYCHECMEYSEDGETCASCGEEVAEETLSAEVEDFQDLIRSVQEELGARLANFSPSSGWHGNDRLIGTTDVYAGNCEYSTIYITLNGGYYDGACLDYDIEYHGKELKTGDRSTEWRCNKIRSVLKKFGREYVVSARFSNGETMYSPVI